MIRGKKVLAIIPARGGSRGLIRKNIQLIAGKPLIAWTIEEAKKSNYLDRFILSSEDEEIISIAESLGCEVPFVRPSQLAQDDTPMIEVVLHAIKALPTYNYAVLLQPTSPLRNAGDIDGCIEYCVQQKANACVSVTESEKNPYWMYLLDSNGRMRPLFKGGRKITRRQDLPTIYSLNGAVYVGQCDWLLKKRSFLSEETVAYVMPRERSVDVDTELDFKIAALLLEELKQWK